jgi:hypothetical protein
MCNTLHDCTPKFRLRGVYGSQQGGRHHLPSSDAARRGQRETPSPPRLPVVLSGGGAEMTRRR